MNSQITSLVVFAAVFIASKQVPFEDPTVLHSARQLYLCIQLFILLVNLYIALQIQSRKDATPLPKANPPTTIYKYDRKQWPALIKSQAMGLAIVAVMHLYFKLPNPLVLQSILPLNNMWQSKLVQIHVFGNAAVGDLERPWEESQSVTEMWQKWKGSETLERVTAHE
ncbi:putative phosphate transporter [Polychaeton citri CBS 116435]|uniref:Phosphate transporter n=1 Tax=Polychaeton citri CBS 116435 TaxID=1314669 RepID=A0A9P4Q1Q4_9PEZI|nr:putative phosphate transporter [Polychaeton citri CBS 116435]